MRYIKKERIILTGILVVMMAVTFTLVGCEPISQLNETDRSDYNTTNYTQAEGKHICTDREKAAEICTLEYLPVCGNDNRTYGNKCSACASKQIESYIQGECQTTDNKCNGSCPQISPPSPNFCTDGIIIPGKVDECGCNLPPRCNRDGIKNYVAKSQKECTLIEYACETGIPFNDEIGCGCFVSTQSGKLKAYDCSEEQRNVACTKEYVPVCGWFDPAKIQCIKYPCASNYGNKCEACADEKVISYTEEKCPN